MANSRICSIPDCGKPAIKRGWCSAHYQRWRAHGDPLGGRVDKGGATRWLEEHVNHTGEGCLIWPFSRSSSGYARINYKGRYEQACRVMCRLAHGEPPSDTHEAAHKCGKGHDGCIHPKHLSWKTPSENAADKLIHGTDDRGEKHYSAKLTEDDVREIRRLRGEVPQKVLAARYGVVVSHICGIQRRHEWAWLD